MLHIIFRRVREWVETYKINMEQLRTHSSGGNENNMRKTINCRKNNFRLSLTSERPFTMKSAWKAFHIQDTRGFSNCNKLSLRCSIRQSELEIAHEKKNWKTQKKLHLGMWILNFSYLLTFPIPTLCMKLNFLISNPKSRTRVMSSSHWACVSRHWHSLVRSVGQHFRTAEWSFLSLSLSESSALQSIIICGMSRRNRAHVNVCAIRGEMSIQLRGRKFIRALISFSLPTHHMSTTDI